MQTQQSVVQQQHLRSQFCRKKSMRRLEAMLWLDYLKISIQSGEAPTRILLLGSWLAEFARLIKLRCLYNSYALIVKTMFKQQRLCLCDSGLWKKARWRQSILLWLAAIILDVVLRESMHLWLWELLVQDVSSPNPTHASSSEIVLPREALNHISIKLYVNS